MFKRTVVVGRIMMVVQGGMIPVLVMDGRIMKQVIIGTLKRLLMAGMITIQTGVIQIMTLSQRKTLNVKNARKNFKRNEKKENYNVNLLIKKRKQKQVVVL